MADIIDNLVTNAANKPLSAAQGYKLKGLVDTAQTTAKEAKSAAGIARVDAERAGVIAEVAHDNARKAISVADSKEAAGTAATMLNRATAVNVDDTNYTAYMARGMSLNAAETTPTVNGTIAWHYK